jgi:hypothetical protein
MEEQGHGVHNTLGDLNNHLFAEIERLGEEDLKGDDLTQELRRAEGISKIAVNIVDTAQLVLKVSEAYGDVDAMDANTKRPRLLEGQS